MGKETEGKIPAKGGGTVPISCAGCQRIFKVKSSRIERSKAISCSRECARRVRNKHGRNNPNYRYCYDRDLLSVIDTEFKAYLLGLIASDGTVSRSGTAISLHKRDIDILLKIRDELDSNIPLLLRKNNMRTLCLNSEKLSEDICRHLQIQPSKKSHIVGYPELPEHLHRHFIRGYFDGDGGIKDQRNSLSDWSSPQCTVATNSDKMRQGILSHCSIKGWDNGTDKIEFWSNNALDFLDWIYQGASIYLARKRDLWLKWSQWVPGLSGNGATSVIDSVKFNRTDTRAVTPSKTRASDSGYDLTLIEKIKDYGPFSLYDTGIRVCPPFGWYFDVVPRSGLHKFGYGLANEIGVIDRAYTGTIKVPLVKLDKNSPDLELPMRAVQIIPRPIVHMQLIEVSELDETDRGDGGFGSTGVK